MSVTMITIKDEALGTFLKFLERSLKELEIIERIDTI